MRERSGLLAAFLGVGAMLYHAGSVSGVNSGADKAPPPISSAAQESDDHPADWELLKNLNDFYLLGGKPPGKAEVSGKITAGQESGTTLDLSFRSHAANERKDWDWTKKLSNRYEWMIATVPDPELSASKLDFDREINSIQNAAESAGYHFDRYWFPWSTEGTASANAANEHTGRDEQIERRKLPGMLLFRHGNDEILDLVVFLAGETPTSGIVTEQFENAIRFGRLSKSDVSLQIAGPGFSGSFASLEKLLEKEKLRGNAQSACIETWTGDRSSQQQFVKDVPWVTLAATTDSSLRAIQGFRIFLHETWKDASPVVLLVEESTGFGQGLAASFSGDDHSSTDKKGPIYVVKFPRGISKLRNATETKEKIPGFAAAGTPDVLKRELPFTLKEEQIGSSELPFFSKEQSPVSQEAVLLNISSLLKKGSLHYAGIFASDPLDLLFLSRFLRSASPNTRLFTDGSDLLFQHGSDGSEYEGMLTVTNYPLIPFNQIWTRSNKDGTVHIFPSGVSEAIYNAVARLVQHGRLREYVDPFAANLGTADKAKPPLWVTVATSNGYAPVAVLRESHQQGSEEDDSSALETAMQDEVPIKMKSIPRWVPEYWESWGYSLGCISLVCLLYAVALIGAQPRGNRFFAIFSIKTKEPHASRRAMYLFLIGLCLSAIVVMWLAVPYIVMNQNSVLLQSSGESWWQWGLLRNVCAGIGLVVIAGLLLRCEGKEFNIPGSGLLFLVALLLLLRTVGWHASMGQALLRSDPVLLAFAAGVGSLPIATAAKKEITFPRWRSWGLGTGAVMFCLTIFLSLQTPSVFVKSPALSRLWWLLYGGAAVLGVSVAAMLIPLIGATESLKRRARLRQEKVSAVLLADGYWRTGLAFAAVAGVLLCWTGTTVKTLEPQQFLAACRALNLTSGVCPLAPLTLSVLGFAFWSFIQLRRVTYHEDRCPRLPSFPADPFCPELNVVVKDVKRRLIGDFFHPAYNLLGSAGVVIALCFCLGSDHQTVEGAGMDKVMKAFLALLGLSLVTVCVRFAMIWAAFREFLQQLERHPLREVFSCLPRGFLWAPLWQGGGRKRTHIAITRSIECITALVNHPRLSELVRDELRGRLPELTASTKMLLQLAAQRRRVPAALYQAVQRQLCSIGTMVAAELKKKKWPKGSYETRAELSTRATTKSALSVSRGEFEVEEPYTIAGELLALRFVPFVNYVLLQLQNLAVYLSGGFILLVVAMNCYVFRARTVIDWVLAVLFLLMGGAVITVFSQLDRDAIFSRITRTEEGKLDSNFFFHLVSYGAIPTLALLASHVPTVAKFFFSWIKPAMEAIH